MSRNLIAIRPEDRDVMHMYAKRLAAEPNVDRRFSMQLQFVNMMTPRYGHERATRMLSKVWDLAKGWNKE